MIITEIEESNNSNILQWCLRNNANLKEDPLMLDFINDEFMYLITIEDVNFFELYLLTKYYRDQLRIIDRKPTIKASKEFLETKFHGNYAENEKCSEIAMKAIEHYINLTLQIQGNTEDNKDVRPLEVFFVPMISRRYTIQIPIYFIDLFRMVSDKEFKKVFTINYPNTLDFLIESNEPIGFKTQFMIYLSKVLIPLNLEKPDEKKLDVVKFKQLATSESEVFYDPKMIRFEKIDKISKRIYRYSFFKGTTEQMISTLKKIKKSNGEMFAEFAVNLPLEYLQNLENSYSSEMIEIKYRSAANTLINRGFNYNQILKLKDMDKEVTIPVEMYTARLRESYIASLYNITKLADCYKKTNNSLLDILSLLPSIHTVRCILRINLGNIRKIVQNESNSFLKSIFIQIQNQINLLYNDIEKA